jgi:hypothetical protein
MPEEMPTRAELIREFAEDEESCFDSGRLNNISDIALSIVSVLGSLAATVLVSTGAAKALIATFAAVPAASTTLQRIIDFRGRSLWYFRHSANLKALTVSLRYATNPDLEAFARRRADLEVEAEQRWAQIGSGNDAPTGKARRKRTP